jgi:superfamily II DNA or RNA helicase
MGVAISCQKPPLDDEQAKVIQKSIGLLQMDVDHVVEAPTGWGKTYAGAVIAVAMNQATLIVVTKSDLMGQWRDTLINLVGVDPLEIGIAQAAKLDYKGKRFVLATVQSLIRPGKYSPEFFNAFGMVIFDETHRMAAECFSRACFLFPARYRIGLSATPKRNDGKTPVVDAHIGPVMARGVSIPMPPKVMIKKTGWTVPDWCKPIDPGNMASICKAMANPKVPGTINRNRIILRYIQAAYQKNRTTVVMAEHIANLEVVKKLCGLSGIPWDQMGDYTSEAKKELHTNAFKRVVFATYGMCGEGTNYPHWDTMVQITPRANVEQPIGRVLRKLEGKAQPLVLDLLDNDPILKGFHYARQKTYHKVKGTLVYV